ncbi:MAG: hypothetical protein LBV61_04275 [Burkholderiaceae bacterium]|jgi:hypothetical protein|nr:hypothetical protein [Burkholderiaceae bacterium]
MPCATPCKNCDRKGLPILFTRYGAAYSARAAGMNVLGALQPDAKKSKFKEPNGVHIQTALYSVRMLRPGYLYVCVERPGAIKWQGFTVHPHGYLNEFEVMFPAGAQSHPACEVQVRGANASMVWIADAKRVKKVWYMFHPDPIDPAHLLKEIQPNLDKYMQSFDAAGWAKGSNTGQKNTCAPEQLKSQVLEFAALSDEKAQTVGCEQHYGLMGTSVQERGWGNYEAEEIIIPPVSPKPVGLGLGAGGLGPKWAPAAVPLIPAAPVVTRVTRKQPAYAHAHGGRLNRMVEFLNKYKGAVVACEDPIGIAQELSLHHLSAAIPYVDWLKETDSKGVSNQWKQAASESIKTLKNALSQKTVRAYDEATERLKIEAERRGRGTGPFVGAHKTLPDGSTAYYVKDLGAPRRQELQNQIDARNKNREHAVGADLTSARALSQIAQYCNLPAREQFDALHTSRLKARDDLMDQIAADLQAWLKADAFTAKALGRYSAKAGIETGDGARCAGQLCAILLQMDNAPKGRQWYAALDVFTPGQKNLVWRMLSLNNAQISAELNSALDGVAQALPPAGLSQGAQDKAAQEKTEAAYIAALAKLTQTLAASDKINSHWADLKKAGLPTPIRVQAAAELAPILYDSPVAVVLSAVMARFKALPESRGERLIAQAQLALLARGLGKQAAAFIKRQAARAQASAATSASTSTAGIEKAIGQQISAVSGKDMRVSNVLLGLNALAILPALANAKTKGDARTSTALLGAMASLVGGVRQWRADVYEKALFKNLPELVETTHRAGMSQVTQAELLALKAGAARYVAAGAAVGVAWDAVDGGKAAQEKERALAWAYFGRMGSGGATIFGVIVGARYFTAPLWLLRLNLVTLIATIALTEVISRLKGDAWANWLQAQPFRADLIHLKDAPQTATQNTKLLYKSEQEMMDKLADALAEME